MKKKIQLLALMLVACVMLNSCVVVDALKNYIDFHKNFQPNIGTDKNESTGSEVEDSTTEVATDEQIEERLRFEAYLDEMFVESLEEDAFTTHFILQYPERYNITFDEDDYVLANYEDVDYEEEWEEYAESIADLKQIDKSLLTKQQQMLYDKLIYEWEFANRYKETEDYGSYIGGDNGIVFSLACNFYEYTFLDTEDIEAYLKFLQDIPNYIDYAIEQTKLQMLDDFIPTKYMLKTNMDTIDSICSGDTNVFIDGFEQKIADATFLTRDEKNKFLEENKAIVEKKVNPAFTKLYNTMEDWYSEETNFEGLSSLEGGKEYYEYLVEHYTGSDMSVNEMYRYLLQKLESYENAFVSLIQSNKNLYDVLTDGKYGFQLTEPDDILNSLVEYTKTSYPTIQDPGYVISWLPDSLQSQGLLAYYVSPQIDVTGKNVIRLNASNLDSDLGRLYTTLAHEGYPGHLYAINYIQQQDWHPVNELLSYLGYTEGWAEFASYRSLYCWEEISEDVASALIYNEEMGYILQAITDIGINYKGWSLDDVYDVWSSYYDIEDKEELQDVYDFFVAEPGAILSYPMGYLQIMDLRSEVKTILGKNFSDTQFAEAFLNVGGAPFSIVEEYVIGWAKEKASQN